MATISERISESLSEYLILTGCITTRAEHVSLRAEIGNPAKDQKVIKLEYPYATARMQSVAGPQMAMVAGRVGILTLCHRSLRDSDKIAILEANKSVRLCEGDIEFQEKPNHVTPDQTLEDAIALAERTGNSVIPVFDRFSELHGFYIHTPEHPPSVPPGTSVQD